MALHVAGRNTPSQIWGAGEAEVWTATAAWAPPTGGRKPDRNDGLWWTGLLRDFLRTPDRS